MKLCSLLQMEKDTEPEKKNRRQTGVQWVIGEQEERDRMFDPLRSVSSFINGQLYQYKLTKNLDKKPDPIWVSRNPK